MSAGGLIPFAPLFVSLAVAGAVGNAGLLLSVKRFATVPRCQNSPRLPQRPSQQLLLPDAIVLHLGTSCLLQSLWSNAAILMQGRVCCADLSDSACSVMSFMTRYLSTMGGWFTLLLSLYRYAKLRTLDRPSLAVTRLEGAAWPRRCCTLLWAALALVHSPTLWFAFVMRNDYGGGVGGSPLASSGNASVACGTSPCLCQSDRSPGLLRYWQVVNYCGTWLPVALMLLSNAQMVRQLWRHRRAVDAESNLGAAVGSGRARACVQAAKVVLATVTFYVVCKGALGAALTVSIARGGVGVPLAATLTMSVAGPLFSALCPFAILTGDARKRRALLAVLKRAPQRNGGG
ncbi:uncharacterized protein LOC142930608 [Petromyzon marinus]|uniref:uncharacterized protein LOC142930608 n=1 Tax=Petromyzon marinus TaxID=7757 RepID=UPI003F6F5557